MRAALLLAGCAAISFCSLPYGSPILLLPIAPGHDPTAQQHGKNQCHHRRQRDRGGLGDQIAGTGDLIRVVHFFARINAVATLGRHQYYRCARPVG